jgi:hypothetical protein
MDIVFGTVVGLENAHLLPLLVKFREKNQMFPLVIQLTLSRTAVDPFVPLELFLGLNLFGANNPVLE